MTAETSVYAWRVLLHALSGMDAGTASPEELLEASSTACFAASCITFF